MLADFFCADDYTLPAGSIPNRLLTRVDRYRYRDVGQSVRPKMVPTSS